ncbi:MAG: hypothetical protein NTZ16_13855 [Verrucomicrobia bacterium]|nr:hypothetical protein [Verrucomicrobiota bacterium]
MKTTTPRTILHLTAAALLSLLPVAARAADGTWIANATGYWHFEANWADGVIADGEGSTATFTTFKASPLYIALELPRTIGSIVETNNGSPDLHFGGAQTLTLDNAGAMPVIDVHTPGLMRISCPLAGKPGFVKKGRGMLWLNGDNQALESSAAIAVAEGALFNQHETGLGNATVAVSNGCFLSFWIGGTCANAFHLYGTGGSKTTLFADGVVTGNGGSFALTGAVNLHTTVSVSGSSPDQTITLQGPVTGEGGLVKDGKLTLIFSGEEKTYTGSTVISNGTFAVDGTVIRASAVTNCAGTVLAGNGGKLLGSATILNTAKVTPGRIKQVGSLTVNKLNCLRGATLVFDLSPTSLTEGGNANDLLTVTNLALLGKTPVHLNFTSGEPVAAGRRVIIRYTEAAGLENLALSPAAVALPCHPTLDTATKGEVAIVTQ